MHVVGKIFIVLGAVLVVVGGLSYSVGKDTVEDNAGEFLELENQWAHWGSGANLSIADYDGMGDLGFTFWVGGEYLDEDSNGQWDYCDATNITILSHPDVSNEGIFEGAEELNGTFYYEVVAGYDRCESTEENKDLSREDDGLVKVGRACWGCYEGTLEFEADRVVGVIDDDAVVAAFIEDGKGFLGGLLVGGFGVVMLGCGSCFLLTGGILWIVLGDPKEATQIQQPPSV